MKKYSSPVRDLLDCMGSIVQDADAFEQTPLEREALDTMVMLLLSAKLLPALNEVAALQKSREDLAKGWGDGI